jgi:arginine utilization regulatory protein
MALQLGLGRTMVEVQRRCIATALDLHGGNITKAAAALRVSRQSLQRKMRRLKPRQSHR